MPNPTSYGVAFPPGRLAVLTDSLDYVFPWTGDKQATMQDFNDMIDRVVARVLKTPPVPDTPIPDTPTGKLGIKVTQKYPIGTNAKFAAYVAYCDAVNGVGPLTFSLAVPGKYRMNGDTIVTNEQLVGTTKDVLTINLVDGFGETASATFEVAKVDAVDGIGLNTRNPISAFVPLVNGAPRQDKAPVFIPVAYGPSHADTRSETLTVTNQDGTTSKQWQAAYGAIYSTTAKVPPGSYPVRITRNKQVLDETLVITPIPPITDIQIRLTAPLSRATAPGSPIGKVAATVPDNAPVCTITDPAGILTVDPSTREIRTLKRPDFVGDLPFRVDVSCGGGALTGFKTFSVKVVEGTIIDPSKMTLPVNPKLDNSTPGQKIGQLKVEGQTGGTWRITEQSGFNPLATTGQYGIPARYQVDATGLVYTPPNCLLSWQDPDCNWEDDKISALWTSPDGLTTCLQTFVIPVANTAAVFVLKATDKATAHAAAVTVGKFHPGIRYQLEIHYNPNEDEYVDWTRGEDTKNGMTGPIDLVFVPGPNGELPRIGGKGDNTGVNSGVTSYGKGHIISAHGDMRIYGRGLISGVHGPDSTNGREAIRKEGNTYGNLALFDFDIENCDQGVEANAMHGYLYCRGINVRRCGGATIGAGLTHGFYIGAVSKFELVDSYVDGTPWGHLVKSRAMQTILRRNVIDDTGAAACCIDLSDFGDILLEDNYIRKGPMASNPTAININAEGAIWKTNRAVLNRNVIINGGISYGGNYGPTLALMHFRVSGSTVTGTDNKVWLPPLGQLAWDDKQLPGADLTNTTLLTVPLSPPRLLPPPTMRPYRERQLADGKQDFPDFTNMAQLVDTHDLAVSGPGVVCTITPVSDIDSGLDNKFAGGWTSSIAMDQVKGWRFNPTPWAPLGSFSTDGGKLIYNGGLAPGGYFVQVRFTTLTVPAVSSVWRYLVTVR
jgi:hypothetical protein